ncbi:type II toxin-antitoxin system HicB family antitoxin [Hassallia byssoidea VB512170]|uniref:Type II toxin-antitoxin system HicB family antitoxin n=1 Tax=Hassallia byssoidea VB512170 TaxID=1304833 RepID=A0A846HIN8_9CYAN|nr:type II toxin-antitoxin system HicB family antitoxin [Hassalia byssoidea]NEU76490.1 type II toxin-antitoxin system HicB family antitoxin [Hassalia byssoidea VB512170]
MKPQYTILIQWSTEDQKYIVSLPEFGPYAHTHGDTYGDAVKNGEEVLELLIEDYQAQGKPLPEPITANVAFVFV